MSEIKLLPCPICNGEVKIALFGCGGEEWYSITRFDDEENSCQCRLFMESEKFFAEDDESVKEKHKQDLINRWNTRKPMERIIERLEEGSFPKSLGNVTELVILKNKAIEICKEEGGR
jgi:hypothetical protein